MCMHTTIDHCVGISACCISVCLSDLNLLVFIVFLLKYSTTMEAMILYFVKQQHTLLKFVKTHSHVPPKCFLAIRSHACRLLL